MFGPSRVTVGPDGSVYIKGNQDLTKLDPIGVPATGFGNAGRVVPEPVSSISAPYGPAVLDEAGNIYVVSPSRISKFDQSGTLVSDFGTGGFVSTPANAHGLRRDSAGDLYVLSHMPTETGTAFEVSKLDRDGRPVLSFGVQGKLLVDVGLGAERTSVTSTFVDSAGNFYAAGSVGMNGGIFWAFVAKYDSAGNRIATFNPPLGGGVRQLPCEGGSPPLAGPMPYAVANDVSVDAAGSMLVAVECGKPTGEVTSRVVKLDARGDLDPSYVGATSVPALFGAATMQVMLRKPNGELILAGWRRVAADPAMCRAETILAKLDASGNPVPLPNGEAVLVLEGSFPTELGIDGHGRLYVGAAGGRTCSPHTRMEPIVRIYRMGS
jgi:hypothetical protein